VAAAPWVGKFPLPFSKNSAVSVSTNLRDTGDRFVAGHFDSDPEIFGCAMRTADDVSH
jgi:hypothetical protein